ncbi:MAG: LPS export ABC transporter periplasmic protein LptC [Nitrospirales bacterium]|nr:LPS export ABC transporter periplasmic protein LptC [Nitrospirales bacterium]
MRSLLTLGILGLTLFIGYKVVGHIQSKGQEATMVTLEEQQGADAWIQGFSYRQTRSGTTKWVVTADQAKVFEEEHLARLQDVQVRLFDEDFHKEQLVITSETGIMNTSTNDFDLVGEKDKTVMTFDSGFQVLSDRLTWVERTRELTTTDPVLIKGDGLTITGVGLTGKVDAKEFQVLANVRAEVFSP